MNDRYGTAGFLNYVRNYCHYNNAVSTERKDFCADNANLPALHRGPIIILLVAISIVFVSSANEAAADKCYDPDLQRCREFPPSCEACSDFLISPNEFERFEGRLSNGDRRPDLQQPEIECSGDACVITRNERSGGRSVIILYPLERATDEPGVSGQP